MKLCPRYVAVCLLLLLAVSGRAQVTLSHLESPANTSTMAPAADGDFVGHPPSVVFAGALGAASGGSPGLAERGLKKSGSTKIWSTWKTRYKNLRQIFLIKQKGFFALARKKWNT